MSYRIAEWQGSGIHVLVTQRQSDPDPEVSLSFTGKRFCKVEHNGRHFVNPDYVNLEGMAQLADIIVRGIRSLEEDRAVRVAPPLRERIVLDEDTPEDPDWGWPGHGAG